MASNSNQYSFHPLGNTVAIAAATSAPTGVQVPVNGRNIANAGTYRIINDGTVMAFVGVGTSASGAQDNADVVTSSQASIPVLPGACEIMRFSADAYFSAITSSGSATIYITPGQGL